MTDQPKVVHEWESNDTSYAIVRKPWMDLPPENPEEFRAYMAKMGDTLRVVDACDRWLDCGCVDTVASDELARLAGELERLKIQRADILTDYAESYTKLELERDKLAERVQKQKSMAADAVDGLQDENDRLREALEKAPHALSCGSLHVDDRLGDGSCDCYKGLALEVVNE